MCAIGIKNKIISSKSKRETHQFETEPPSHKQTSTYVRNVYTNEIQTQYVSTNLDLLASAFFSFLHRQVRQNNLLVVPLNFQIKNI